MKNCKFILCALFSLIGQSLQAQSELLLPGNTSYSLCGNVINDLQYLPNRDLYFATNNGVSLYNRKTQNWYGYTLTEGVIDINVNAVLKDSKGNLWTGTALGLSKIDPEGLVTVYSTKVYGSPSVRAYSVYSTDSKYRPDQCDTITIGDSVNIQKHKVYFFDKDIKSLYEDKDGRIWVGTANGVSMLQNKKWKNWVELGDVWLSDVVDIEQDLDGNMWFATAYGVLKFDGENVNHYYKNEKINDVYIDAVGDVWVAKIRSVERFNGRLWKSWPVEAFDGEERIVSSICEDKWGVLWIGTDHGIVRLKDGKWLNTMYKEDGLAGNNVTNIQMSAHKDSVCVGTTSGASFFDTKEWTMMTKTNGLPSANITNITIDGNDLWLGSNNGVTYYRYWFRKYFSTANTILPNDTINDTYVVDSTIWFATNYGAARLNRSYMGDFWTVYQKDTSYSNYAGFKKDVAEYFIPSYYWREKRWLRLISNHVLSVNGNKKYIWFGSDEGASRFDGINWRNFDYDPNGGLYYCPVKKILNFNDEFYFGARCGLTIRTCGRWGYIINNNKFDYHFSVIDVFGDCFLDGSNNLWLAGRSEFRWVGSGNPVNFLYSIDASQKKITEYGRLQELRMYNNIANPYGYIQKISHLPFFHCSSKANRSCC